MNQFLFHNIIDGHENSGHLNFRVRFNFKIPFTTLADNPTSKTQSCYTFAQGYVTYLRINESMSFRSGMSGIELCPRDEHEVAGHPSTVIRLSVPLSRDWLRGCLRPYLYVSDFPHILFSVESLLSCHLSVSI